MDPAFEAAAAQTSRGHNIARNQRLLRVLCFAHVLSGRGWVTGGAPARRARAWWNRELEEGDLEPVHPLPCALELRVRGRWRDVTVVCGQDMDAPREVDPGDDEMVELLHATDAALEAYDADEGLCFAFETAVDRVLRPSPGAGAFRPEPLTVENAFRRYREVASTAIYALREALATALSGADESDPTAGWPAPGTPDYRRLQLHALRGYEATLVSTGVSHALIGEVTAFAERAFRS